MYTPLRVLVRAACVLLGLALLTGCTCHSRRTPSAAELSAVRYTPTKGDDFEVSTPEEQGLDQKAVATLYVHAGDSPDIYSLLLIKNGFLVAEAYFNGGSASRQNLVQSVSKSFTSALVGLALQQGCIQSVDQKMVEFLPEIASKIKDPRKRNITIRHLLQMRAGYPWEESWSEGFKTLYSGFRTTTLVDFQLNKDPGSGMEYSNLSSHALGLILKRACKQDLRTFAQRHLHAPLGIEMGDWWPDLEGNFLGFAGMHFKARDLAKFGQLYLDGGKHRGTQLLPESWVRDSLKTYSSDAWPYEIGPNVQDMGYGYQWWSARAGQHHYNFAWGHGGQEIALVPDQRLVIVLTSNPLQGEHGGGPWEREKANLNLVGDFIAALPKG